MRTRAKTDDPSFSFFLLSPPNTRAQSHTARAINHFFQKTQLDYLPLTVLSCCCCWPVALMAIYHSRLVRFFYSRGQFLQVCLCAHI